MSVMQRNAYGGTATGEPLPIAPAQLQRQAVMDQLGTTPRAQPQAPGPASAFQRGGQVTQLPGSGVGGKVGDMALGLGTQVAGHLVSSVGQNAAQQGVSSVASQVGGRAASLGAGAASLGTGAGISIGTDLLAKKLRVNEEAPTFGGAFGDLTDDMGRRFQGTGGGIASNAVKYAGYGANPGLVAATGGLSIAAGALGGVIKGAITKHAPSAFTDFKVEDAAQAINGAYEKYLGRPASQDEIQTHLVNQGWNPTGGDRWVGEKNLTGDHGVLAAIRDSPEAAQRATRGAVMDQLGTPPGGAAEPPRNAVQGQMGAMAQQAPSAALDATVQSNLTPAQVKTLQDWNNGADSRRAAFQGETDRLQAAGWDGRAETRGSDVMGDQDAERAKVFGAAGLRMPGEAAGAGPTASATGGGAPFRLPTGTADGYNADGSGGFSGDGRPSGGVVSDDAGRGAGQPAGAAAAGRAGAGVTEGFDSRKYGKNDPKYVFQRIASQFDQRDPAQRDAMLQALKADPSGFFANASLNGDILDVGGGADPSFNGMTRFDVVKGLKAGGQAWVWQPADGGGGGGGQPASGGGAGVDVSRAAGGADLTGGGDTLAKLRAELQRILAGSPDRNALLAQMGGTHG